MSDQAANDRARADQISRDDDLENDPAGTLMDARMQDEATDDVSGYGLNAIMPMPVGHPDLPTDVDPPASTGVVGGGTTKPRPSGGGGGGGVQPTPSDEGGGTDGKAQPANW